MDAVPIGEPILPKFEFVFDEEEMDLYEDAARWVERDAPLVVADGWTGDIRVLLGTPVCARSHVGRKVVTLLTEENRTITLEIPMLGPGCEALAKRVLDLDCQPVLVLAGLHSRAPLIKFSNLLIGVAATPASEIHKGVRLEIASELSAYPQESGLTTYAVRPERPDFRKSHSPRVR